MNVFGGQSDSCKVARSGVGLLSRSLFLHAWDLAEDGIQNVFDWCRDSGLNAVTLAATYHSGWFIHPHSHSHRAYMTEGGACYFHPQDSLWKKVKVRPRLATLCQKTDWFAEAARRAEQFDLDLISWTVGCHNSHLGGIHPELTQRNVYDDSLPHALCPAQPEVREYLWTLCRDLATNHRLSAIQLEAFGWMGFVHGHHHERDLVGLTVLEQELMGLCLCKACTSEAAKAGVDIRVVKGNVRSTLQAAFCEAPNRPTNHPTTMAEFETRFPEAKEFNGWRRQFLISLVTSIKSEALAGTQCRLLLQTGFDVELAGVVDGFSCFAFGKTPAETKEICSKASKLQSQSRSGLMQCCVQLGMGLPESEQQLREIVRAVDAGRCNGVAFYNRSEAPPKMLAWLKSVGAELWSSPRTKRPVATHN